MNWWPKSSWPPATATMGWVTPYDVEDTAAAIRQAVEMSPTERRARMARMRAQVREQNVDRWAGRLLSELARIAPPAPVRDDTPGDKVV
jgi:trehalose-6-phosphate synthase